MKNAKLLVVMMILAMVGTFIGCSKPPATEKSAAKIAMDAAVSAEAPRYASTDYAAAEKLWKTSEAQMQKKKYSEAKQGYIDAKSAFEKAIGAVAAGKKAVAGDVNPDEVKASIARLEEDWTRLQALAKKVEPKLKKKKLWENDSKTFTERLQAAKDMLATDPVSVKLKIADLRSFIVSYTKLFKQIEAAPVKTKTTRKRMKSKED